MRKKDPVVVYPKEEAPNEVIDEYSLAFVLADAISHCVVRGFTEQADIEEVRFPNKATGSFKVKASGINYVVQVKIEKPRRER